MSMFIDCVQTGASEYAFEHDEERQWRIKSWRCELTALSQLYNLYFIACNDKILVYQPDFPDQSFASEPVLVLYPPVSSPNLRPGIDREDPHSITRLLVGYLGNEEILLATCDDGDVVGYRIAGIQRALDEISQLENEQGYPYHHVPPFLHQNVGASAWGLAIHREARIIAISANTYEVTILAFALASRNDEPPELDSSGSLAATDEADPSDFPSPRRHNNFFKLGATHNIPAVSFNNNDEDPAGQWLFGSSITGQVWLWDLHGYPNVGSRTFQMGFCASAQHPDEAPRVSFGGCGCLNEDLHPHASWGAMFLDPRSAHEVPSLGETPESARRAPSYQYTGTQKVRFRESKRNILYDDSTSDGTSSSLAISGGVSEGTGEDIDTADGHMSTDGISEFSNEEGADEDSDEMEEEDNQDHEPSTEDYDEPSLPPMQLGNSASNFAQYTWSVPEMLLASGASGAILALSMQGTEVSPYRQIITNPEFQCKDLRQPSLIITKDDIFLIQRPFADINDSLDPILTMRYSLHPGPTVQSLLSHDRQCFATQIPELGIFIIGSPLGRVAIFALTKSRESRDFGFQLEYILPFYKHNENEILPPPQSSHGRMVGVAVGPVQGELGRCEESRDSRWRLLMYFKDHSLMSFELSRKRGGGDVGLGELIV